MVEYRPDASGVPFCSALYHRRTLLHRHPIMIPFLLLCGSLVFSIASFFSATLFPVLMLLGIPSLPCYLSLACVLGISGIVASIISILEHIDRQAALYPRSKEHSYAHRN